MPGRLSPTTERRYRSIIDKYLEPELGHRKIGSITHELVQRYITRLAADPTIAPGTVRNVFAVLRTAINKGVRMGIVRSNPCVAIDLPRPRRQEMLFLTADEVRSLAEAIDPCYRVLVYTAAYAGLRAGELAGLQRQDVDPPRNKGMLVEGDAVALPFDDGAFDYVWMMWLLEHIADPPAALREARRVLGPGGRITAIEVDYATCRTEPSTPAIETLSARWSSAWRRRDGAMPARGYRAGSPRPASETDEGARAYWWVGDDLAPQARHAADVMESAFDALAQAPGVTEEELRAGLNDHRGLPDLPGAGLGWVLHKSAAVR